MINPTTDRQTDNSSIELTYHCDLLRSSTEAQYTADLTISRACQTHTINVVQSMYICIGSDMLF